MRSMDPSAEGEVLCTVWTRQLRGRYCTSMHLSLDRLLRGVVGNVNDVT